MPNPKKILIVGGVAGGATVGARLRRLEENAQIILFERGGYVSFANCGLPYYIGGTIQNRDDLLLQTPKSFHDRFNLDVRIHSTVTSIDPVAKTVTVQPAKGEAYTENYTHLVLSTGAKPLVPPITGINSNKIFTLRNIEDTDAVKSHLDSHKIRSAIVIGGGFIGIEMLENLIELGVETSLVEAVPHILAPLDGEMAVMVEDKLRTHGAKLHLNEKATEFHETENGISVHLASGEMLEADMVLLAIGVTPDTAFLANSGIELVDRGYIKTNEHLQTNFPEIYALGDAILVADKMGFSPEVAIPLAGPANRQGRIVADNIAGLNETYKGSLGTAILKVFEMTVGSTGYNERTCKRLGLPHEKIYLHPNSHASYYPNAKPLAIKVLFNPENQQILGAQAMGEDGVDKFIDTMATVLQFKGTLEDLAELELAYAPPYSSAKSPANMVGFVGLDMTSRIMPFCYWEEALQANPQTQVILDVRNPEELTGGSVKGALNLPLDKLRHGKGLEKLDKTKEILTYCGVGVRGYIATRYLLAHGYKARNILGGFKSRLNFRDN